MQYPSSPYASPARATLLFLCAAGILVAQTEASEPLLSNEAPAVVQGTPPPGHLQPAAHRPEELEPNFPLATPLSVAEQPAMPLDFGGKVDYFMRSALSPQSVGRIVLTTGLWQGGGSEVWGDGFAGYRARVQARYYEHLTRRGIQFAFATARGEDPRFYRSQRQGFWNRTKFVLSRTVVTQMDDGSTSIAVGRLAGIAGGNFASAYWRPDNPNPWKHTLENTAVNVAGDVGMRMLREFWPDLKRTLLK